MDSAAWDARYADSELVWSAEPNRFVAEGTRHLSPGRAVDLAAGEGRNALWLASRGWAVTAVDFSRAGLAKGEALAARAGVAVEWVCADATQWVSPVPVDLVVVAYLQLPPKQRRAAVRGAFSSLAPGGTLLVVAHDSTNLAEGTGGPQDPTVLMTADDLLEDLAGEPMVVEHAGRVARDVGGRTAWDCLLRVRRSG